MGSADTNDYYRFTVGSQSNFSLGLTGLTADADVQLLNSAGSVITSSSLSGSSSESINTQLSTGTYYVRVFPFSGDTSYNLSLNATPTNPVGGGSSTIGIAVDWNLAAYRQNNIFWQSGYAPNSMYSGSTVNHLDGSLGNCTWYVNGRLQQLGYSKYALDSMYGNASTWENTAARGVTISSTPQVGAIAQWESNHVAVVERVNSDGTILISESSYWFNGTSYLYNTRTIAANSPSRFLIVPRA